MAEETWKIRQEKDGTVFELLHHPANNSTHYFWSPPQPFRIDDVSVTAPLDIDYVRVGLHIVTAFRRERYVCHPHQAIEVIVTNPTHHPVRAAELRIRGSFL